MDETSPALPNAWIGKLFSRFRAIYGNRVQTMYGDADSDELFATWAAEIRQFETVDRVTALNQLRALHPDYPPTLFEFSNLCREARRKRGQTTMALAGPKTEMPPHIREQLRAFVSSHKL